MRMQSQYAKDELNKRIDDLLASRNKLKCEYNIYIESAEAEKKKRLQDLEEAKESIKHYEEQLSAKDVYITELLEQHAVEIDKLNIKLQQSEDKKLSSVNMNEEVEVLRRKLGDMEEALKQSQKEVEEQHLASELAEQQLKGSQQLAMENDKVKAAIEEQLRDENLSIIRMLEENKELNSKAHEFNEELNFVYSELESVKDQVKLNKDLKLQIEQERLRTEKTEKEMTDFLKNISALKDEINSNQYLLEGQVQKIGDKHSELQLDIKGLQENVKSFKENTGTAIVEMYSAMEKVSKQE
jgi:chromosome segregation ATPase